VNVDGVEFTDPDPGAGIERGTVPGVETASPETAPADLFIERGDLPAGSFTFIRQGDPIPVALAGFPRSDRATDTAPSSAA
jgi:hypothetical protein